MCTGIPTAVLVIPFLVQQQAATRMATGGRAYLHWGQGRPSSEFAGVTWCARTNRWRARSRDKKGKNQWLGSYGSERAARDAVYEQVAKVQGDAAADALRTAQQDRPVWRCVPAVSYLLALSRFQDARAWLKLRVLEVPKKDATPLVRCGPSRLLGCVWCDVVETERHAVQMHRLVAPAQVALAASGTASFLSSSKSALPFC